MKNVGSAWLPDGYACVPQTWEEGLKRTDIYLDKSSENWFSDFAFKAGLKT